MTRFLFCVGILLLWGVPSAAQEPREDAIPPASGRGCGHVRELEAAKRALAQGDREQALDHLRRARAFVAACERSVEDPGGGGDPAVNAFAKALTAGSELEPT